MLRFLLTTTAVLAPALPATAQDAEVGMEYEITIETEEDNPYTGPYGEARIGSIVVNVPDAKVVVRGSRAGCQHGGIVRARLSTSAAGGIAGITWWHFVLLLVARRGHNTWQQTETI